MALSSISLEDNLARHRANDVDEEEDCADGYVLIDGGTATEQGNAVREVWRLQAHQSLSVMKKPARGLTLLTPGGLAWRASSMIVRIEYFFF